MKIIKNTNLNQMHLSQQPVDLVSNLRNAGASKTRKDFISFHFLKLLCSIAICHKNISWNNILLKLQFKLVFVIGVQFIRFCSCFLAAIKHYMFLMVYITFPQVLTMAKRSEGYYSFHKTSFTPFNLKL